MNDSKLSSWVEHYTRFRGRGRPDAVVRRFGKLLGRVFELQERTLRGRSRSSKPGARQEMAASILRVQATRARALASSVQALTDDKATAKIAMAAFANVLMDGGFCETLEAAIRGRAGAVPPSKKRRQRHGN